MQGVLIRSLAVAANISLRQNSQKLVRGVTRFDFTRRQITSAYTVAHFGRFRIQSLDLHFTSAMSSISGDVPNEGSPTVPSTMEVGNSTVPRTMEEENSTVPRTIEEGNSTVPRTIEEESPTVPSTMEEDEALSTSHDEEVRDKLDQESMVVADELKTQTGETLPKDYIPHGKFTTEIHKIELRNVPKVGYAVSLCLPSCPASPSSALHC